MLPSIYHLKSGVIFWRLILVYREPVVNRSDSSNFIVTRSCGVHYYIRCGLRDFDLLLVHREESTTVTFRLWWGAECHSGKLGRFVEWGEKGAGTGACESGVEFKYILIIFWKQNIIFHKLYFQCFLTTYFFIFQFQLIASPGPWSPMVGHWLGENGLIIC